MRPAVKIAQAIRAGGAERLLRVGALGDLQAARCEPTLKFACQRANASKKNKVESHQFAEWCWGLLEVGCSVRAVGPCNMGQRQSKSLRWMGEWVLTTNHAHSDSSRTSLQAAQRISFGAVHNKQ